MEVELLVAVGLAWRSDDLGAERHLLDAGRAVVDADLHGDLAWRRHGWTGCSVAVVVAGGRGGGRVTVVAAPRWRRRRGGAGGGRPSAGVAVAAAGGQERHAATAGMAARSGTGVLMMAIVRLAPAIIVGTGPAGCSTASTTDFDTCARRSRRRSKSSARPSRPTAATSSCATSTRSTGVVTVTLVGRLRHLPGVDRDPEGRHRADHADRVDGVTEVVAV